MSFPNAPSEDPTGIGMEERPWPTDCIKSKTLMPNMRRRYTVDNFKFDLRIMAMSVADEMKDMEPVNMGMIVRLSNWLWVLYLL